MIIHSIIKFQELTKYDLSTFVSDVYNFLKTGEPQIVSFFAGKTNDIPSSVLNEHKLLLKQADTVVQQFKANAEKLETAEFWFVLDFIEDLRTKLQTISNMSKYMRSSRVDFTYRQGFEYKFSIGDGQTLENISQNVLNDPDPQTDWTQIALRNDLMEADWEADEGKQVIINQEKFISSPVTTFIDNMIGDKIYGIDICRKITFENDDLKTLSYKDTVYQCVDIMSCLKQGDIPEFPSLGINSGLYVGNNVALLTYTSIARELKKVFSTDDLFVNFTVVDIQLISDKFYLKFSVDTKYKMIVENTTIL